MTTASMPMDEWKTIPWPQVERRVFKLQTRIYHAARRGDHKTVHQLQRLLMSSQAARVLAVRRVTQDNRGKKTAGIDGVKALSPPQRLQLARDLRPTCPPRPAGRVWVPKPGTGDLRPLAIPVMADRAAQALVKLALDPEWEARFESNSYGFRPGRSAHDAIGAIFNTIRFRAKYVLDADIAYCFDSLSHQALLDKLQTFPLLRRVIRGWLTAGILEGNDWQPTPHGAPQGGVLSPLLMNAALHGLETAVSQACGPGAVTIRYADDFVVLHEHEATILRAREVVEDWLRTMGLELKPSKTRITHTLDDHAGNVGFDFLGFAVRQYRVGRTHSARNTNGTLLGFKTIITPSTEAIRRHNDAIRVIVQRDKGATQAALISHLNPVQRGWARYYATVVSSKTFGRMDYLTYQKLRSWAYYRHPHKPRTWIAAKYWRLEQGHWRFGVKKGPTLYNHVEQAIRRHVKVRGDRSPYDGDWAYWARRLGRHPELPRRSAALLRQQDGTCAWCGLYFRTEDRWECDHRLPLSQGGTDTVANRQLLHVHCHDVKTAQERSSAANGSHDKSR